MMRRQETQRRTEFVFGLVGFSSSNHVFETADVLQGLRKCIRDDETLWLKAIEFSYSQALCSEDRLLDDVFAEAWRLAEIVCCGFFGSKK